MKLPWWIWQRQPDSNGNGGSNGGHGPKNGGNGGGPSISVPFEAGLTAVPGGGMTTLYDAAGHSVAVPAPEVQHWLDRGMRRTAVEVEVLWPALEAALASFRSAAEAYASESTQRALVDRSDNGTSHVARDAWVSLEAAWRACVEGLEHAYPPA